MVVPIWQRCRKPNNYRCFATCELPRYSSYDLCRSFEQCKQRSLLIKMTGTNYHFLHVLPRRKLGETLATMYFIAVPCRCCTKARHSRI